MLEIEVNRDEVHFGASMTVRFMRTLRVPDDGREYSLPTLGEFPVYAVQDYADRVPASWRARPGVFIPMHPHEAMVISLSGRWWKPNAVKIAVREVNALTGQPSEQPQRREVRMDRLRSWLHNDARSKRVRPRSQPELFPVGR